MSESTTPKKSNKKSRKKAANKNKKSLKSSIQEESKIEEKSLSELITKFDQLFLDKENPTAKKNLKEFARNELVIKENDSEETSINYQNFIILLLKLCGMEIDLTDDDTKKKFIELDKNSSLYTSEKELENLIEDLKIRREKIKYKTLTTNLNEITSQLYTIFDFGNKTDQNKFKEFIIALFKLTQNHTRKIRQIGSMILCQITELIVKEYSKYKKLLKQMSNSQKTKKKDANFQSRNNLCNCLNDFVEDIIKNFIKHKICDYSKDIRMNICEMLEKLSKNYFNIIFGEFKLVEYYNYFLQDPSNAIRVKYLGIIYDRLVKIGDRNSENEEKNENNSNIEENKNDDISEDIDADEKESLSIIIEILKKSKGIILSICVKEETFLAKSGIKILELLSKNGILEIKTVYNLVLHLFHENLQIRKLITQITINYILNFEQPDKNGNIPKLSVKNVHHLNQLALRLTGKVPGMMEIFVDDFFDQLNIIKNYKLLFDYINELLNQDEIECDLLLSILILIDKSIKQVKNYIEFKERSDLIKFHDEFCEQLLSNVSEFIKKLRYVTGQEIVTQTSHYEIITAVINLIENFKLYQKSTINVQYENIKLILEELKKTFIGSIYKFKSKDSGKKSSSTTSSNKIHFKNKDSLLNEERIINSYIYSNYSSGVDKLIQSVLKAMSTLLNDKKLYELFNYNDTIGLDEIIFSQNDNSDCLASMFFKTFQENIIGNKNFIEIAKNSGNSDISQITNLILENYDEHVLYILINQMNYLLIYFPQIFKNVDGINLYQIEHFLIAIFRSKIANFNDKDFKIVEFNYNYIISIINLIETLHMKLFNYNIEIAKNSYSEDPKIMENINQYIDIRNRIITLLFLGLSINYKEENKTYNSFIYLIKGKCLGVFIDMFLITNHEKIQIKELEYDLIPNLISIFYKFVRDNFVKYLWSEFKNSEKKEEDLATANNITNNNITSNSNNVSGINEEEETRNINNNNKTLTSIYTESSQLNINSHRFKKEIFWSEYKLQNYILKIFAEKFSRLLLCNFKIYLNDILCYLYFETFFLLPQNSAVQQIIEFTLETMMTKECQLYIKYMNEMENNNSNQDINKNIQMNIMLFYMNKIILRIFNNDSPLFNDENNPNPFDVKYEDKMKMCERYINIFIKMQKKLKTKFNKEKFDVINKDKRLYENLILNGIAFALDKSYKEGDTINLENVFFLDFVKLYIKNGIFVDEQMIHDITMLYLKISKKWEITENMNMNHIKFMEKFKSYILNKGHFKVVENKEENDEDDNEKIENEGEEKNAEEEKEKEKSNEKKKTKKEKTNKSENNKKKKRNYIDSIKEEKEEEHEESPKNSVRKKYKKEK